MSFATFGPLPKPQPNPVPGLPALEAAIRRLEATTPSTLPTGKPAVQSPTPASADAGAAPTAPACRAAVPGGQTTSRLGAGGTGGNAGGGAGHTIWQVAAALLAQMDPDARCYVQRVFLDALEAVEADLALPPERRRLAPVPFLVQHWSRPRFEQARLCEQDQRGIDRLLRLALWRAVAALEAAALLPEQPVYLTMLAEQCAQFERVYQVLKRRAGRFFASAIFEGELRFLRHHRGSAAAERLLFS
jgi:hypothetical protein